MKKIVAVLIDNEGIVQSVGTNKHWEPCRREGYHKGEGYDLCYWCNHYNHAEIHAAKGKNGGRMIIVGASHVCEPCQKFMKERNITWELIQ